MAKSTSTTATVAKQHPLARAVLMEAAERIIGKEHSRDDLVPGSYPFEFSLWGIVGKREFCESFLGTLDVGDDGVKTPSTPYQRIAAFLFGKMNDATRTACLTAIAAGTFDADETAVSAFEAACKQYREAEKARNPERKRGDVRPVYEAKGKQELAAKPRKAA